MIDVALFLSLSFLLNLYMYVYKDLSLMYDVEADFLNLRNCLKCNSSKTRMSGPPHSSLGWKGCCSGGLGSRLLARLSQPTLRTAVSPSFQGGHGQSGEGGCGEEERRPRSRDGRLRGPGCSPQGLTAALADTSLRELEQRSQLEGLPLGPGCYSQSKKTKGRERWAFQNTQQP